MHKVGICLACYAALSGTGEESFNRNYESDPSIEVG